MTIFLVSCRNVICFLALAFFASLSHAQNAPDTTNIFRVLELRGLPQSLSGKDLTAAWRVLQVGTTPDQLKLLRILDHDAEPLSTDNRLYTRGDVVTLGSEAYLVVYRPQPNPDLQEYERLQRRVRRRLARGEAPDMRIEETATLALSLLHLRTAGNLTDVRAFDPARDLLAEAEKQKNKVRDEREESISNLKQLGLGLMQYVQDYDEKLPPMRAARSRADAERNWDTSDKNAPVFSMLFPYLRASEVFFHPGTGRPYVPNWRVSRKNIASIQRPAQTVAFYEDAPDSEGLRNVLFLDGHVESMNEEKWKRIAKENKIPP